MANLIENTRLHDIVFKSNGRIEILARASRLLGLEMGDAINICVDEGEHYLYVYRKADSLVGKHICRCHPSRHGSHNFRCSSKSLSSHMLSLCGSPEKAGFWCGNPIVDATGLIKLPIITRFNVIK